MIGRRVYLNEGIRASDLEPGDYAKMNDGMFWMVAPNGAWGRLNPLIHKIVEHEDGTITVSPSILIKGEKSWHGFLKKGIWESC
jgi:hypothetical protein